MSKVIKGIAILVVLAAVAVLYRSSRMCCAPPPSIAVPAIPTNPKSFAELSGLGEAIVEVQVRFERGGSPPLVRTGAGFVVTNDGWIVTSAELLLGPPGWSQPGTVVVGFSDGVQGVAGSPRIGGGLALLKVAHPTILPKLELLGDPLPGPGAEIHLVEIGVDRRAGPTVHTLVVRRVVRSSSGDAERVLVDDVGRLGAQGAPVFHKGGAVIGVVVSVDTMGSVLSVESVRQVLSALHEDSDRPVAPTP